MDDFEFDDADAEGWFFSSFHRKLRARFGFKRLLMPWSIRFLP